jgi:hypothetical protein
MVSLIKDMEVMKFMVNCLKTYYPLLTAYVVVYDAPFVFQAFWRILKLLLNKEIAEKVKFVDKRSIREFFAEDMIPIHMGGTVSVALMFIYRHPWSSFNFFVLQRIRMKTWENKALAFSFTEYKRNFILFI